MAASDYKDFNILHDFNCMKKIWLKQAEAVSGIMP